MASPSPPNSPRTIALDCSAAGAFGFGYECMSWTSPAILSSHPLASFTRRVGSAFFTHAASLSVPNSPHPSLNTTHMIIEGWLTCVATSRASSASNSFLPSAVLLFPLGMSCHTMSPSRSAQ